MPLLTSNGINIYHEAHGEGTPLLLIQGTFDSMAWACQVPALMQKYRVITYDHRGLGRTDAPEGPYTIGELAEDAIGLLSALGVKKAHVLGYSLGGSVALEMAARRPEMVGGLILAATYNGIPALGRYRTQALIEMFEEDNRLDRVFKMLLPWFFPDDFFKNSGNPDAFLKNALNSPFPIKPHGLLGLAKAIAGYHGLKDLSVVKSPTLVISGGEDIVAPVREGRNLSESIPGAKFNVLEGAAHTLIFEDAERFNSAVIDFLAKL